MAGRRITTFEATVKTASVEIKTLTVRGKQVTQMLFRQLEEEALIDPETLQWRGVPWGRVNYFWGACKAADHARRVARQTGVRFHTSAGR